MGKSGLPKPARTIHVYDKGNDYLLLDDDDTTPLYHIHFTTDTMPRMVVSRATDPQAVMGSAIFYPKKKSAVWSKDSRMELSIHHDTYRFKRDSGFFSIVAPAKRMLQTQSHGLIVWKGGYVAGMKLTDGKQNTIAEFQNMSQARSKIGAIVIMKVIAVDDIFLDEIVISAMAMLSDEKRKITYVDPSSEEVYGGL